MAFLKKHRAAFLSRWAVSKQLIVCPSESTAR